VARASRPCVGCTIRMGGTPKVLPASCRQIVLSRNIAFCRQHAKQIPLPPVARSGKGWLRTGKVKGMNARSRASGAEKCWRGDLIRKVLKFSGRGSKFDQKRATTAVFVRGRNGLATCYRLAVLVRKVLERGSGERGERRKAMETFKSRNTTF
jgi:hypothetical protein